MSTERKLCMEGWHPSDTRPHNVMGYLTIDDGDGPELHRVTLLMPSGELDTDMELDIARLAASAPYLLAACKDARDTLLAVDGLATDPSNPEGWSDQEMYADFMRLDAAIAKAEGE
ncbi:hypothetical protein LCGC14_2653340 [marine sediment metagenome]|uniref:Uncharacterized protein n=1 Tax=marine sediment metagenome TaxID=412755 RepID=A0A0F9CL94_9ZZZZ